MVREPAAVVTAVYAHVTVDLLGIVATKPLVLEHQYVVTVETVPREEQYVSVKRGSTVMIAQVSLKQVKNFVFLLVLSIYGQ